MRDGLLSLVGVQAEATFNGAGTGSIYRLIGLREFEHVFEPIGRTTKINVWRHESKQARAGVFWTGRYDTEISATADFNLILSNLLALVSSTGVAGGTKHVYRLRRAEAVAVKSLKWRIAYDQGPWVTLHGVVITGIRCTIRAQALFNIAVDFTAVRKESVNVNPSWTVVDAENRRIVGSGCAVSIDDAEAQPVQEISFAFELPREVRNLTRSGVPGALSYNGPAIISGSINPYFSGAGDLVEKVTSATEFKFAVQGYDEAVSRFELSLPRVAPQSGQADPVQEEVTSSIAFKGLSDTEADPSLEPTISLTVP